MKCLGKLALPALLIGIVAAADVANAGEILTKNKMYVGPQLGLGLGWGSTIVPGATAAWKVAENVGPGDIFVGGNAAYYLGSGSLSALGSNWSLFQIGIEGNYYLQQIPGLYGGLQLAMFFSSYSTGFGSATASTSALGLHGGYDHPLSQKMSVGARLDMLASYGTGLNIAGNLKFWF